MFLEFIYHLAAGGIAIGIIVAVNLVACKVFRA